MRHADRPAEWFEVELGSEWQACREGFGSPPGPHEVASEAVQKPSSAASRRSENHTLLSTTVQKTYVRRFFVYHGMLDDASWTLALILAPAT